MRRTAPPIDPLTGATLARNDSAEAAPAQGLGEVYDRTSNWPLLLTRKPTLSGGTGCVIWLRATPAGVSGRCVLGDGMLTIALRAGESVGLETFNDYVGPRQGSWYAQVDRLGSYRVRKLWDAEGIEATSISNDGETDALVTAFVQYTGDNGDCQAFRNKRNTVHGPARRIQFGTGYRVAWKEVDGVTQFGHVVVTKHEE